MASKASGARKPRGTRAQATPGNLEAVAAAATDDPEIKLSIENFQLFISLVFSISIFGASTFAVIAGQMADPADIWRPQPPPFSMATVRNFLAVAWLCFILAIAVAGYSSSILAMHRQSARGAYRHNWGRTWKWQGVLASLILHQLLIAAFAFLSLAMVAYVGAVGWVAVGFCGMAEVIVVVLLLLQWRQV